jgi:chromosome segregation ATPase
MPRRKNFDLAAFDPAGCDVNATRDIKAHYRSLQAICDHNNIPYRREPGQLTRENLCFAIQQRIRELRGQTVTQPPPAPSFDYSLQNHLINELRDEQAEMKEIMEDMQHAMSQLSSLVRRDEEKQAVSQLQTQQQVTQQQHHQAVEALQRQHNAQVSQFNNELSMLRNSSQQTQTQLSNELSTLRTTSQQQQNQVSQLNTDLAALRNTSQAQLSQVNLDMAALQRTTQQELNQLKLERDRLEETHDRMFNQLNTSTSARIDGLLQQIDTLNDKLVASQRSLEHVTRDSSLQLSACEEKSTILQRELHATQFYYRRCRHHRGC